MKQEKSQKCERRRFISLTTAATGSLLLGACSSGNIEEKDVLTRKSAKNEIELNKKMPNESVMKMLDQRVNNTMEKAHHCAQTAFIALSEQFGLGGDDIIKALTPLPGIAERGGTCGAITGSLMALGLVFGRERLDDWEGYQKSLIPTGEFCERFEEKLGSSQCKDIVHVSFGKELNLRDPEDLKEFQRAGATEKCSVVVRTAVRIAADIILDKA